MLNFTMIQCFVLLAIGNAKSKYKFTYNYIFSDATYNFDNTENLRACVRAFYYDEANACHRKTTTTSWRNLIN